MSRASSRRVSFVALVLLLTSAGCFALFSLDEYGPASAVEPQDANAQDAIADVVIVEAAPDTSPLTGKLVFVTRAEYRVNDTTGIQSTTKANALCQQSAVDAGLPGTFYAWLSNTSESPSTKFVALIKPGPEAGPAPPPPPTPPEQLITTNNQLIAADYAELIDGGPRIALTVTEVGTTLPMTGPVNNGQCPAPDAGGVVWTATSPDGRSAPPIGMALTASCFDWQSSGQGAIAVAGRMAKHRSEWTAACSLPCNTRARLYCFQQ
jgi:hypothetical protein